MQKHRERPKMELQYKQIMDYIRCPLLYKFKYILEFKREDREVYLYKSALKSVAMYFYYNLMNGTAPTLGDIQSRWQRAWGGSSTSVEDILFKDTKAKTLNNYNISGLKSLNKFYESEMRQEFTPIVVNTDVRLPFGDHFLTDTLDLVRETKEDDKSIIEVVRLSSSTNAYRSFGLEHDFRLAFQTLAFRTHFEVEEDRATLYNIKRGSKDYVKVKESEFARLEATVSNIGDNIMDERFYPVVAYQCRYCPYQDVCNKYKF